MRIFVPGDAGALALGAEKVAAALVAEAERRGLVLDLVRNGSRGLYWLEPLVEIATAQGRIGFGPVRPGDVAAVLDLDQSHPSFLGPVEAIPYLARQERLTFARCGIVDPLSLADYEAHGGLAGLRRALEIGPQATIEAVTLSGLRGRGGGLHLFAAGDHVAQLGLGGGAVDPPINIEHMFEHETDTTAGH